MANEHETGQARLLYGSTNLFNFFDVLESPFPSNARLRSLIVTTETWGSRGRWRSGTSLEIRDA